MEIRKKEGSDSSVLAKRKRDTNCSNFEVFERVLCFEPDVNKAKVLYDAKIMDICETKDKRGRKKIEFLIHFQGWSSSWDRRVDFDFVLKDTEENRKLQRDLAEKSQLQLGAYLYRKERKKRRKLSEKIRLLQLKANPEIVDGSNPEKIEVKPVEIDSDKITTDPEMDYSSSVESSHEDDRVFLCLGDFICKNLEMDEKFVTKDKVLAKLPATPLNVVTILENFVRYYTFKQLTGPQEIPKPKKKNKQLLKQKESPAFDLQSIENNVELCKEVADGLRIYFNFILKDYLLYPQERDQANEFLSPEYLRNFVFVRNDVKLESLQPKPIITIIKNDSPADQEVSESVTSEKSETGRRLRSHSNRNEESENLSSMASTSSNDSEPLALSAQRPLIKTPVPMNIGTVPPIARKLFEETLAWKLLQDDANPEASMIYGIVHLTRLIVKLPEFLSVTSISEEKLILLLKFLNHFVEFLEDHEYLYGEQNYNINENVTIKVEKNDSQESVTVIDTIIDIKPEQIQENPLVIQKKTSNIQESVELVDERFK